MRYIVKNVSELEQQHIERKLRKMPRGEWKEWLQENEYVLEKPEKDVDLPQDLGMSLRT